MTPKTTSEWSRLTKQKTPKKIICDWPILNPTDWPGIKWVVFIGWDSEWVSLNFKRVSDTFSPVDPPQATFVSACEGEKRGMTRGLPTCQFVKRVRFAPELQIVRTKDQRHFWQEKLRQSSLICFGMYVESFWDIAGYTHASCHGEKREKTFWQQKLEILRDTGWWNWESCAEHLFGLS